MKKVKQALKVINKFSGVRKTPEINQLEKAAWREIKSNMEEMVVDIDAAEFAIDPRYQLQTVTIPAKKRGNLSLFAGKKCYVFTTTISRQGARINFYICEA